MIKLIKFLIVSLTIDSTFSANATQTAFVRSTSENATAIPPNHKNTSELLDKNSYRVNSSLRVAESRLFPVGMPNHIPQHLVSPFDVASFGKQLLPLINVNIKQKVKHFAKSFNDGADYLEEAIRDGWRESPLNPHNFKHILEKPNLFKHLPHTLLPVKKPQPTSHHSVKAYPKHKEKAPKAIESYSVDSMMHDYGINGYKHFEESILRELEKQEELKVEATIHTLFEQGSHVEVIKGKPVESFSGWKPVAAPTKNYDDREVHSQIVSPLHTSIFNAGSELLSSIAPVDISSGFHDFDNLNHLNTIHSTYNVHEELGESKVKPVKARITPIRAKVTSETQRESSRYRKRENEETVVVADSGTSGSHEVPKVAKPSRTISKNHIQSLTTLKPNKWEQARVVEVSSSKTPLKTISTSARPSSTTTTTPKPSKHATRQAASFVDKPRVTGKRGSIKFGHTTTKKP